MRTRAGLALALALLAGACRTAPNFDARRRGALAESVIASWGESPRLAAAMLLEQYGPPDAIAEDGLGWRDRGPWKRIVVRDADDAVVRQTVAYHLPDSRRQAVTEFGRTHGVSARDGELSAASSEERLNFLALNLANEVARGMKSPEDARVQYARTLTLDASGKFSPYLQALLFRTRD